MARTITQAQLDYITSLAEKRLTPAWVINFLAVAKVGVSDGLAASQAIDELKAAPWKPRPDAAPLQIAEKGYYRVDGEIYTVCKARKSENTYAKILVNEGTRGRWDYVRGMVTRLKPENRITIQEAKEFGHLHGFCLCCGKPLTDPKSVEAGIGPVCAKKV